MKFYSLLHPELWLAKLILQTPLNICLQTHGLLEDRQEQDDKEDSSAPNQSEILLELLQAMRSIQQHFSSCPPRIGRHTAATSNMAFPAVQHSLAFQSPPFPSRQFQQTLPQVSHHSPAMLNLPNQSLLDDAIPKVELPQRFMENNGPQLPADGNVLFPQFQSAFTSAQPLVSITPPPSTHVLPQTIPVVPSITATRSYSYKVDGLSFPVFTREDEMQYRMLRMALDNLLDANKSEHFKYHVLLHHLKVGQARKLALGYSYTANPYTQALHALDERYGQPRQLVLKELKNIMGLPHIRAGDGHALDNFALRVQALVGLLGTMEEQGKAEMLCGSRRSAP